MISFDVECLSFYDWLCKVNSWFGEIGWMVEWESDELELLEVLVVYLVW